MEKKKKTTTSLQYKMQSGYLNRKVSSIRVKEQLNLISNDISAALKMTAEDKTIQA